MKRAIEAVYNVHPDERFPYLTLAEGAHQLKVSPNRLSRLLRILSVPVYRKGYTIFLDGAALGAVKAALKEKTVRPGRKKKSAH
jgi:hypothetical protein